jgi:hypothetical protein
LVPPSARATIRQAPGGHNLPISTIAIPDFFELLNFIRCIGIDRVLNVMVAAEAVDNSQSTVTGVAGRLDWPAAPQPKAAERTSMSQFGTARMSLRDRCATYAGDGRTAYKIVNSLFASIIVALRRDPRFRNVQAFDLELLLADTRVSAERLLIRELKVRVHLDDIGEDP